MDCCVKGLQTVRNRCWLDTSKRHPDLRVFHFSLYPHLEQRRPFLFGNKNTKESKPKIILRYQTHGLPITWNLWQLSVLRKPAKEQREDLKAKEGNGKGA